VLLLEINPLNLLVLVLLLGHVLMMMLNHPPNVERLHVPRIVELVMSLLQVPQVPLQMDKLDLMTSVLPKLL